MRGARRPGSRRLDMSVSSLNKKRICRKPSLCHLGRGQIPLFVTLGCGNILFSRISIEHTGGFSMKKIIVLAAVLPVLSQAEAQTICRRIGTATYCANGLSTQPIGNTTFYNNGSPRPDIATTPSFH